MGEVELSCSEPMPTAAMEVKSTAHSVLLRSKDLCAGTHDLAPGVVARWGKLATLRHCTIHRPVTDVPSDIVIAAIRHSRHDSPVGIALRAAERIVTLGIGTVPECVASGGLVGMAETLGNGRISVRQIAAVRRVMAPDIVGDVDVGAVEDIIAVDVDGHIVVPPVASAPDCSADRYAGGERDDIAGDKARR